MTYSDKELWDAFVKLGKDGLRYSHYDLAKVTPIPDALAWREFLMHPKTQDYIRMEMEIIRNAAINEMVQNSADSRSVGQSQLLNALQKIDDGDSKRNGPTFIYCHVPVNREQSHATNVRECTASGIEKTQEGGYIIDET